MIGVLEIKAGYATKLDRFRSPVEFKNGLNILFGPNGCGKSTALRVAAAHCSVNCNKGRAGWSRIQEPATLYGVWDDRKESLPRIYRELSPGKCEANLEWDGTPTLLADPEVTDQTTFGCIFNHKNDSPDGMSDFNDQIAVMFGCPSAGMLRMGKLKKYADTLKNPPCITEVPREWKNYNDTWLNAAKRQVEYISGLPRSGLVTFMMDEPDRSFSIENQMVFWTRFITEVAAKCQVVVATHCPFSLCRVEANWIDFDPDYRDKSLSALGVLKSVLH